MSGRGGVRETAARSHALSMRPRSGCARSSALALALAVCVCVCVCVAFAPALVRASFSSPSDVPAAGPLPAGPLRAALEAVAHALSNALPVERRCAAFDAIDTEQRVEHDVAAEERVSARVTQLVPLDTASDRDALLTASDCIVRLALHCARLPLHAMRLMRWLAAINERALCMRLADALQDVVDAFPVPIVLTHNRTASHEVYAHRALCNEDIAAVRARAHAHAHVLLADVHALANARSHTHTCTCARRSRDM